MTSEEILQTFSDINHAYNNSSKYDTLKRMLDELTEPCEDCISRAEALKYAHDVELEDMFHMHETVKVVNAEDIESLPSVQPIRPKGEWIPSPYTIEWQSDAKCSNCGRLVAGALYDYVTCPYCSADMR